jgi:hypothetical protein
MGLKDVTLGYDVTQANAAEGAHAALGEYELAVSQLAGAYSPNKKDLKVHSFLPVAFVTALDGIIEALAAIVQQAGGQ